MTGEEALEALAALLDAKADRRGDMTLTLRSAAACCRSAAKSEPYYESAPPQVPQLQPEPQYPRLKVLYDTQTFQPLEYKVIHSVNEEVPFMGAGKEPHTRWFTRPMNELKDLQEAEKDA